VGIIEDFIERVKNREGFRFDKEVADLIGINKESLASAKQRGQLPNTYTKWYCKNYNIPLDRFHQDIKLTNITMDLGGSNTMEAQRIIDNQERLIHYQEKEIVELKKEVAIFRAIKKPAFHFSTNAKFDAETRIWNHTNHINGDVSMTGYTIEQMGAWTPAEWRDNYHPDSEKKLRNPTVVSDFTHNKYIHMMFKHKEGSYICLNIDSYYERTTQEYTAYFYWVNGDLTNKN